MKSNAAAPNPAWNKGRRAGQKPPLTSRDVLVIRALLEAGGNKRDLALFNLAIDSKLNACDLVGIKIGDVWSVDRVRAQARIVQQKSGQPLRFVLAGSTRRSVGDWLKSLDPAKMVFLFPSRVGGGAHISTRHYARLVRGWIKAAGLDAAAYGTHSLRRSKPAQIYRKTGNLRAVQRLLGHSKRDSTLRYLGSA